MGKQYCQSLGKIFRIARIANDYSIKELADKTDLSSSYICEIEKGNKLPSTNALKILSNALNLSLKQFTQLIDLYDNVENGLTELKKYQLILIIILKFMIEKEKKDEENIKTISL